MNSMIPANDQVVGISEAAYIAGHVKGVERVMLVHILLCRSHREHSLLV